MKLIYLLILTVYNIGFLQHLPFSLIPVYISAEILHFHQVLEQINAKFWSSRAFFCHVAPFLSRLALSCRDSRLFVATRDLLSRLAPICRYLRSALIRLSHLYTRIGLVPGLHALLIMTSSLLKGKKIINN